MRTSRGADEAMDEDRKLPGLSSHRVGETRATTRVVELEARGAGLVASHQAQAKCGVARVRWTLRSAIGELMLEPLRGWAVRWRVDERPVR